MDAKVYDNAYNLLSNRLTRYLLKENLYEQDIELSPYSSQSVVLLRAKHSYFGDIEVTLEYDPLLGFWEEYVCDLHVVVLPYGDNIKLLESSLQLDSCDIYDTALNLFEAEDLQT